MKFIEKSRLIAIVLFGLALNISISAAQVLAAVLLLHWLCRSFGKKRPARWSKSELDFPIIIFILWALLSAVTHTSPGLRDTLGSQSAFLLFFFAAHALDLEETELLFRWIGIGAVIVGFWGILQVLGKVNYLPVQRTFSAPSFMDKWPSWLVHELALNNDRAQGFRNHALTYAESIIPGFFIVLAGMARNVKWGKDYFKKGILYLLALGALAGGILFAQGRAVWCGVGIGVLVFGWTMGRRFFLRSAFLIGISLLTLMVVSPQIRGRILSVVSSSSGSLGDQYSKSIRFTLWKGSLEGIHSHPWMGQGLDGARLSSVDPISGENRIWTETHNLFLQYALELGLIGLGLFLWILVIITRMIWNLQSPWRSALAGLFVAFLIAGLTESWPKDKEVAMLFWLMIGSLAFLRKNEEA